jgi:hypothetical protein
MLHFTEICGNFVPEKGEEDTVKPTQLFSNEVKY